jgi:hypothetical protein
MSLLARSLLERTVHLEQPSSLVGHTTASMVRFLSLTSPNFSFQTFLPAEDLSRQPPPPKRLRLSDAIASSPSIPVSRSSQGSKADFDSATSSAMRGSSSKDRHTCSTTHAPFRSVNTLNGASSATRSEEDHDLDDLRSFGLNERELQAIQQAWMPSLQPDASNQDRSVDVKARFGFLSSDKAKQALESNKSKKAFSDAKQQQRYEAYLRAQAGEDRAYFKVRLSHFLLLLSSLTLFSSHRRSSSLNSSTSTLPMTSSRRRRTHHWTPRRRGVERGGQEATEGGEEL